MIFVCGCGHSGTSLVTAMLGSHGDIYSINEETYLFTRCVLNDSDIRAAFRTKYLPAAQEKGAKYICEKTPIHIGRLDRIRKVFAGAQIFVPVRDPRDVALSIKLRTGRLSDGYLRWIEDNSLVRRELEASAKDLFVFRYEDFIDDLPRTLSDICGRIGLSYDPAMLNYHQDKRPWFGVDESSSSNSIPPPRAHNAQFRNWQIKQPIMERRGLWKANLTRAEINEVQRACEGMMKFYGYDSG